MSDILKDIKLESKQENLLKNTEYLYQAMRITTDARFQASKRLNSMNQYAFLTTTIISLGLILIPLLQLSKLPLQYSEEVLGAIQIFFAVTVLVYSVIIATAKYSVRSLECSRCADSIKDLAREVKNAITQNSSIPITEETFNSFNFRYRTCLSQSENHSEHDYFIVKHSLNLKDNSNKNLGFFYKWIESNFIKAILYISRSLKYLLPTTMMIFALIVILDILGITHIMTPFLLLTEN